MVEQELLIAIKELTERLANLEKGQTEIRDEIAGVKTDLQSEIAGVKSDLQTKIDETRFALKVEIAEAETRMSALIENKTQTAINVLTEGYQGLSEKLGQIDEIKNDMDDMKGGMAALEAAIYKNSASIIEIKKAQG